MNKQKSEEMQLECNEFLTSPISKRKNESTLRQLQNDVMGKARSTLSSLGDVLKGNKNVPGSPTIFDQQYKSTSNDTFPDDMEHSFTSPPRSPKTPKDKSSLDFFSWSKHKTKESSKSLKKEKLRPQQSLPSSNVNKEDFDSSREENVSNTHQRTKTSSTGTVKKNSLHDSGNISAIRQGYQGQQQKTKYSTHYVQDSRDCRLESEFSRSLEDGLQCTSRNNVHGGDKYYDCRPKSYIEKYAPGYDYMYDPRANIGYVAQYEDEVGSNPQCILKAPNPSSPTPIKHILFNEENDILYYKDNQRLSKTKSVTDHHNKEKQKISHIKYSSTKDNRKMHDTTSIFNRKVSREEKLSPTNVPNSSFGYGTTEPSKYQKQIGNVEDKNKINPKSPHARPALSRDFSVDFRLPANNSRTDYNEPFDSRSMRQVQYADEEHGDRKCTKKICFQEPAYEDKIKCDTLPRSRAPMRKNEPNKHVNEYFDTDMLRPRSGSLDSDLESQAMRIVRTVGQAFEVCHKLSVQDGNDNADEHSETSHCDFSEQDRGSDRISDDEDVKKDNMLTIQETSRLIRPNHLELTPPSNMNSIKKTMDKESEEKTPLSATREITSLKEQLDQQQLQTRQILAQLMLVREQLISETNARIEAQARIQQLLQQNRELLEHISSLGGYHEPDRPNISAAIGLAPQYPLFQNQQALTEFLGLGSLNQHFSSIQQLNSTHQSTLPSMQQTFNNNNGSYSTLNKLHNMNNNIQAPANAMGSTLSTLTAQDLYKLNQSILNHIANSNCTSMFSTFPSANLGCNQQQHSSFIFANQNTADFNKTNVQCEKSCIPTPVKTESVSYPGDNNISKPLIESTKTKFERESDDLKQDEQLSLAGSTQFIKPLSQVGTLTTMDADGTVKVIVPVTTNEHMDTPTMVNRKSTSFSELSEKLCIEDTSKHISILKDSKEKKTSIPNLVTLKVTDESGAVTKRLPATPSCITRSTSEKVPNRSQIMSQVQRTQWARHTTK